MQRIRMKADAPPTPILHAETGKKLGVFLPGLGYWVTPENHKSIAEVLERGHAIQEDASAAPLGGTGSIELDTAKAQVAGFLKVGE